MFSSPRSNWNWGLAGRIGRSNVADREAFGEAVRQDVERRHALHESGQLGLVGSALPARQGLVLPGQLAVRFEVDAGDVGLDLDLGDVQGALARDLGMQAGGAAFALLIGAAFGALLRPADAAEALQAENEAAVGQAEAQIGGEQVELQEIAERAQPDTLEAVELVGQQGEAVALAVIDRHARTARPDRRPGSGRPRAPLRKRRRRPSRPNIPARRCGWSGQRSRPGGPGPWGQTRTSS